MGIPMIITPEHLSKELHDVSWLPSQPVWKKGSLVLMMTYCFLRLLFLFLLKWVEIVEKEWGNTDLTRLSRSYGPLQGRFLTLGVMWLLLFHLLGSTTHLKPNWPPLLPDVRGGSILYFYLSVYFFQGAACRASRLSWGASLVTPAHLWCTWI